MMRLRESLAFLMFHMGEWETAQQLQSENVTMFRASGELFRAAIGTGFLSYLEARRGRYAEARALQRAALATFRDAGDMHWCARTLILAAAAAAVAGDFDSAAKLTGAFDTVREPLGDIATPLSTLGLPHPAIEARVGLGDEAYERAYAAGRAMSLDDVGALLA
jgi:hypothetical protein